KVRGLAEITDLLYAEGSYVTAGVDSKTAGWVYAHDGARKFSFTRGEPAEFSPTVQHIVIGSVECLPLSLPQLEVAGLQTFHENFEYDTGIELTSGLQRQ